MSQDLNRRTAGAYVITHESTGLFYVGSSGDVRQRLNAHQSTLTLGTHKVEKLQQAFHHDDDLAIELIPANSREEAYDREQALLDTYAGSPYCLNRAKDARVSRRGADTPEETRLKLSQANRGYKHTAEAVEKIRKAGIGRVLSDESKKKICETHRGMTHSEETKAKLKEAWKNRGPVSEETKAKLRQSAPKKPIKIEGKIYDGMEDAARQLGIPSNTIFYRLQSANEKFKDWVKL